MLLPLRSPLTPDTAFKVKVSIGSTGVTFLIAVSPVFVTVTV